MRTTIHSDSIFSLSSDFSYYISEPFLANRPEFSPIYAPYSKRNFTPLSFLSLMRKIIAGKSKLGKQGTAHNYKAALSSFSRFLFAKNITPAQMFPELFEKYQAWLISSGISNNSISFYMRILRAVYNQAVKKGLTPDRKPFETVYTGIDKTRKRAIRECDIKKVKHLDLNNRPALQRARDLFLLSFYCMGISFVDLATLKKNDIANNRLTYRRAKTGQQISIALNEKIIDLFRKYASSEDSPFLLNIVRNPHDDIRRQYQNELNLINRHLKKIGKLAALKIPLTTYVSRHSWASIAKSKNIRLSTISDALGHENESTTRIYLATLDTCHIDKANALILKNL